MHWKTIAFICVGFFAVSASAQVHRCKDVTGKLVFSDRPCESGQTGGQIKRAPTREEILQERAQANDAEARKQDRRMAESERDWEDSRRRGATPAALNAPGQPVNDWQSRKDRDNAATSARSISNDGGRWDRGAEAERKEAAKRKAEQIPASTISHCDAGFCYDNKGGTYHKVGPDLMSGPNGKTCQKSANVWICN